jgi:predicted ATPase
MLLLAMLTLTRLPEPPRLLLIENPERGLYPQWLGDVIGPFKRAASWPEGRPFSQVILTTHSPAVLNFFQPQEVTLLARPGDRPDGPVIARSLQDLENVRNQVADGKARLGELWGEFGA